MAEDEQQFIVRWILANAIGWALALAIAGGVMLTGLALNALLPDFLMAFWLIMAGSLIGLIVGYAQSMALFEETTHPRWLWGSVMGGILGSLFAVVFASLFASSSILARLGAGGVLAGTLAAVQVFTLTGRNWSAARRWALINVAAGLICAGTATTGRGLWLPVSCLCGTGMFGLLTGIVMVRVRRSG